MREFRDCTLPDHLFVPSSWQAPGPDGFVRLDWLVMIGGALRRFYEMERPRMFVDIELWRRQPEGIRAEAREWLSTAMPLRVVMDHSSGSEEFFELFLLEPRPIEFEALTIWEEPSLEEWMQKIAPRFSAQVPVTEQKKYLKTLERELPDASVQPWSSLGFLGGLVRRSDLEAAELFNHEWARFQAWISPQDEVSEENPLSPGEIKINPTLQVLRETPLHGPRRLSLIARVHGSELKEFEIGVSEAAIIDEVAEEGRGFDREQLLQHLSPLGPDVGPALDRLIQKGFILQGREEPSELTH